jgi:hypothetical protein
MSKVYIGNNAGILVNNPNEPDKFEKSQLTKLKKDNQNSIVAGTIRTGEKMGSYQSIDILFASKEAIEIILEKHQTLHMDANRSSNNDVSKINIILTRSIRKKKFKRMVALGIAAGIIGGVGYGGVKITQKIINSTPDQQLKWLKTFTRASDRIDTFTGKKPNQNSPYNKESNDDDDDDDDDDEYNQQTNIVQKNTKLAQQVAYRSNTTLRDNDYSDYNDNDDDDDDDDEY